MAIKGSKRAAAEAPAAAKRAKVGRPPMDPAAKKHQVLAAALSVAEVPDTTREMLVAMIPGSFGVPKEQRHKLQTGIVEMVEEALRAHDSRLQSQIEQLQRQLDTATDEKAKLEACRDEATAAEMEQLGKVNALKAAQASADTGVAEAEAAIVAAKTAQAEAAAKVEGAGAQKAKCIAASEDHYAPLQDSACDNCTGHVEALVAFGGEFGFDDSLLRGFPAAATRTPAERGQFDIMIFGRYKEELDKCIASFEETLGGAEVVASDHAMKVSQAEAALEVAKAKAQTAAADVAAANLELDKLSETDGEARKAVRDFAPLFRKAQSARASAAKQRDAFHAKFIVTFEALRDFSEEAPVPEAPVAAEEAVEAGMPPTAEMETVPAA